MSYCTLDDLKKVLPEARLVKLTDDEGLGQIDTARVDEAIAQADGEIDTYLGGRYGVPLSSVPPLVKRCSCDIAVYHLYSRRVEELPEARSARYRDAVRTLEKIAAGKITLPATTVSAGGFAMGVLETSHFDESAELGGLEVCE